MVDKKCICGLTKDPNGKCDGSHYQGEEMDQNEDVPFADIYCEIMSINNS